MSVSNEILEEIRLFANSVVLGAVMTFVYDGWIILRKVFKHSVFWISLQDISFWLVCSLVAFFTLHEQNHGILRWFIVAGAGVGMLLYKYSLSRFYVNYTSKLLQYLVVYIKKIAYFVFKPFIFAKKHVKSGFFKASEGLKKVTIMLKNRLTVCIKWFTIALCKHNGENGDLHNEEDMD